MRGSSFEWASAPQEPLLYSVLAEGFNRGYGLSLQADGSDHEVKLTTYKPDKDNIQITGTAVDADTGLPLDGFKVMVGELDPDWAYPLAFGTPGQDGKFTLSLAASSSHPDYELQVEKDGYLPAVSANLSRNGGSKTFDFKLQKGSGPAGVVVLPGGEPAANASVLLCTARGGVTIDGPAHVENGLNTTTYRTQTDATGRFALPAASAPQGVIVVHAQGYAEIALSDLSAAGLSSGGERHSMNLLSPGLRPPSPRITGRGQGEGLVVGSSSARSAHRHEADAFAFIVAGDALGVGVESQDAVHQEGIAMVAVLQFHREQPGTVRHLFHRMGGRVPLVEVADQAHGFGLCGVAHETDGPQGLLVSERAHNSN